MEFIKEEFIPVGLCMLGLTMFIHGADLPEVLIGSLITIAGFDLLFNP